MIGPRGKKAGRRREVPRTVSSIFYADKNGPRGIPVAQTCTGGCPDGVSVCFTFRRVRTLSMAYPAVETNFSPLIRDVTRTRACNVNC